MEGGGRCQVLRSANRGMALALEVDLEEGYTLAREEVQAEVRIGSHCGLESAGFDGLEEDL